MRTNVPDISKVTDAQLDVELDAIRADGGRYCLGELQLEIERRLADAIKELYDREQKLDQITTGWWWARWKSSHLIAHRA
jgi:hypothetical protein